MQYLVVSSSIEKQIALKNCRMMLGIRSSSFHVQSESTSLDQVTACSTYSNSPVSGAWCHSSHFWRRYKENFLKQLMLPVDFQCHSSATFLELLCWTAWTCQASPFICVSFTLFYIYSGWVIVAVMTGTVSFTMISFKERMVQDDDSREEELSETLHL